MSGSVEPRRYLQLLHADGAKLAAVVETHPSATVPSMPGYDTGSLLVHTGAVHRWFLACMDADARVDHDTIELPPADFLTWFRQGLDELASVLARRGPDSPTWTWGSDPTTRFWYRRAANETAMHRWDAQNAVGAEEPIDAGLAVDGIDELFDEMLTVREPPRGQGETIHLHATDVAGEWLLRLEQSGTSVTREHAKGDVAARGPASDLLLVLYSRLPVESVETFGDASLLERWQRDVSI